MDAIVPWDRWCALVEPSYHSRARSRHVRGAETMLRMYLLQVTFGLSDEGAEPHEGQGPRARPQGAPVQEGEELTLRI